MSNEFPEGSIKLVAVYNEFIKEDIPVTYVPRSMQTDHWTEEEKEDYLKIKEAMKTGINKPKQK